jgi:hypothetical protein
MPYGDVVFDGTFVVGPLINHFEASPVHDWSIFTDVTVQHGSLSDQANESGTTPGSKIRLPASTNDWMYSYKVVGVKPGQSVPAKVMTPNSGSEDASEVSIVVNPGFVGSFQLEVTATQGDYSETRLVTVTADFTKPAIVQDGRLVIQGTSGDDFVTVSDDGNGLITVGYLSDERFEFYEFDRASVKAIVFRSYSGNDAFVNTTNLPDSTTHVEEWNETGPSGDLDPEMPDSTLPADPDNSEPPAPVDPETPTAPDGTPPNPTKSNPATSLEKKIREEFKKAVKEQQETFKKVTDAAQETAKNSASQAGTVRDKVVKKAEADAKSKLTDIASKTAKALKDIKNWRKDETGKVDIWESKAIKSLENSIDQWAKWAKDATSPWKKELARLENKKTGWGYPPGVKEAINEAKKQINRIEEKADKAVSQFKGQIKQAKRTADDLRANIQKSAEDSAKSWNEWRTKQEKTINATRDQLVKAANKALEQAKATAQKEFDLAKRSAQTVRNKVVTAAKDVAKEAKEALKQMISALDQAFVIEYATPGSLSMNLDFEQWYADLEVLGVKLDSENIKEILGGESDEYLQRYDFLDFWISSHGQKLKNTNNYNTVRENLFGKYGEGNVGFASERIVDWASPETAARLGKEYYFEVGSEGATDEIIDMLTIESRDAFVWLRNNVDHSKLVNKLIQDGGLSREGAGNVDEQQLAVVFFNQIAKPLIKSFVDAAQFKKVEFKNDYFTLGSHSVRYDKAVTPRGGSDADKVVTSSYHNAISVVLDESIRISNPLESAVSEYDDRVKNEKWFEDENRIELMARVATIVVQKYLGGGSFNLKSAVAEGFQKAHVVGPTLASNDQFDKLSEALNIDREYLDSIVSRDAQGNVSSPIVSLLGTDREENVRGILNKLALGNEGYVDIEKLELNISNYTVNVQFRVIHRHNWGSVSDLPGVESVASNVSASLAAEQRDAGRVSSSHHASFDEAFATFDRFQAGPRFLYL